MKGPFFLLVAAGCLNGGNHGPPDSRASFTFSVLVSHLDASIDSARFSGAALIPVADQTVSVTKQFDSYDGGVAAGNMTIEFLSSGSVVQSGLVSVGACTSCVYAGCPSLQTIEIEQVEYSGTSNIAPDTFMCFTCSGGGAQVKACP